MFDQPANSHSTQANAKNSPLLRLPGELRNRIYEHALADSFIEPMSYQRTVSRHPRESSNPPMSATVSLIRTCRQTRSEAEPLFFAHTTFGFDSRYDFHRFLAHVGPGKRELITSISLMFYTIETLEQHDGRYKLPRLEYVHASLPPTCCGSVIERSRGYAVLVEKHLGCGEITIIPNTQFCSCDQC